VIKMRIVDTTNSGNPTPTQTGRAGELRSIDSAKTGSAQRNRSTGTDSVELSNFTGRLASTLNDAAAVRSRHVAGIAAAVRSGTYQVDAMAVSRALVGEAVSSGNSGKL
jgi:flagellar biosynthesis anti-sigma factor FlgM